jgi:hypothetical protein
MRNFIVSNSAEGEFIACRVTRAIINEEQAEILAGLFGMTADQITSFQVDGTNAIITHAVYEQESE